MSPCAQLVENAAKSGFQIARLLSANGVWQAAFRDDGGALFTGSGDTLEAALRDALDSAPTTGM